MCWRGLKAREGASNLRMLSLADIGTSESDVCEPLTLIFGAPLVRGDGPLMLVDSTL